MKKIIALLLIVFTATILSGCLNKKLPEFKKVTLKKDAPKGKSIQLEQIVDDNNVALQLAVEKRDFLSGDKYLEYVNTAKDRDDEARQKVAIAALMAGVNEAQAIVANQTPSEPTAPPPVKTNPTPEPTTPPTEPVTPTEPAEPQRYSEQGQGYSIIFPQGWEVKSSTIGDIAIATALSPLDSENDTFSENITVVPEDLPTTMSSEAYLEANMVVMTQVLTEYQEYERTGVTIDGKSAKKVVFSYKMGEFKIKVVMYFVVNDKRGYVIGGTAVFDQFDNYLTRFEDAIDSFKFE